MNITGIRTWIFRILVAAVAVFIIIDFIAPWWIIDVFYEGTNIIAIKDAVVIHAYGLTTTLVEYEYMAQQYVTPLYQTILAFLFLGVSVLLMLLCTWRKGRKYQFLLGFIGLIYVLYPLGAYMLISHDTGAINYPMQGIIDIQGARLHTYFVPMYFAFYGAGPALILLALLRNVIAPGLRKKKESDVT